MQQRYCECGHPVWVQYILSEIDCRTVFWSVVYRSGSKLHCCPNCARGLHIDELR